MTTCSSNFLHMGLLYQGEGHQVGPEQFEKTYLGESCQGGMNGLMFSLWVLSICSWKLMVSTPGVWGVVVVVLIIC